MEPEVSSCKTSSALLCFSCLCLLVTSFRCLSLLSIFGSSLKAELACERRIHLHIVSLQMADNKTMNYEIASQNSEGEKHRQDVETASEPGLLNEAAANITSEHRDYLIQRHGTVDLDPLPSADPADPYNWPQWKKVVNLGCVAFHVCNEIILI